MNVENSMLVNEHEDRLPSLIYAADLIPWGFKIAKIDGVFQDVAPGNFDIADLRPRSYVSQPGGCHVDGQELRRLAVDWNANRGLADGKRMIAEARQLSSLFQSHYIPLPGTLLHRPGGLVQIAYIYPRAGCYAVGLLTLDRYWFRDGRLACLP